MKKIFPLFLVLFVGCSIDPNIKPRAVLNFENNRLEIVLNKEQLVKRYSLSENNSVFHGNPNYRKSASKLDLMTTYYGETLIYSTNCLYQYIIETNVDVYSGYFAFFRKQKSNIVERVDFQNVEDYVLVVR